MIPLVLVIAGIAALIAGVGVLRSLGPGFRIGRLLASVPQVPLADAVRMAEAGRPRFVGVHGRIDSDEPFEDAAQRPLVYRRTRIEVLDGRSWRRVEESVEAVPFELRDGIEAIGIDPSALGDGLVVVPRESVGVVGDLGERAPAGFAADAPARARIDQLSSVEHATVLGWPTLDEAGRAVMTGGSGRPLVLSVLEPDEAMRVLAGGAQLRPRVAAVLLAVGVGVAALGLAWAVAGVTGLAATPMVEAASPVSATTTPPEAVPSQPQPSSLTGDTRSSGEGPGLVGAPALAIGGVVLLGLLAVGGTLLYVRLTGGPGRR